MRRFARIFSVAVLCLILLAWLFSQERIFSVWIRGSYLHTDADGVVAFLNRGYLIDGPFRPVQIDVYRIPRLYRRGSEGYFAPWPVLAVGWAFFAVLLWWIVGLPRRRIREAFPVEPTAHSLKDRSPHDLTT